MQANNIKPLITGYEGFIGKNLRKQFSNFIGIEYDFMKTSNWKILLATYVSTCDIIFHVGAIADTIISDCNVMLKQNYLFSKELFDIAQHQGKKVIYSSSASVFGTSGYPINIYAWSKKMAEDYGMAKCDDFVSLRYFNVYGPGEEHKGKMASIAYQAHKAKKFKLFPLLPERDFIYINDVVDANISAIDVPTGIYEVGIGVSNTFEEVLNNMNILFTHHEKDSIPSWYQYYTCADKSKWLPNWEPRYDLKSGIEEYVKYLREY